DRTNNREIRSRLILCSLFLELDRDIQLLTHALSLLVCAGDCFFPTDIIDCNEWTNVSCPHARMCTLVFPHVDEFGSFLNAAEGCFHRRLGTTYKGHYPPASPRTRLA